MTSRARPAHRRLRAAAVVLGASVAVAGCTFHPGSAAVVNGSTISQGTIDGLVTAGCGFFQAQRLEQGGATPDKSTAWLRNVFTESLIVSMIVDKAANDLHLTVSQAAVAKATQTMPSGMSDADREVLGGFLADSARTSLQEAVIGAHLKDPSVTNADKVSPADITAAQKYLAAFTAKQHVEVNPAYGTWTGSTLTDTDGSLSAAQSGDARKWLALRAANAKSVTGLPASQVCG